MPNELFKGLSFNFEDNTVPVAIITPSEQGVVVGAIAKLDGRSSLDPNGDGLTYTWSFKQIPIGSQVEQFGFIQLESDSSIVSFAPDITGTYKIQLVVSDGSLDSEPAESIVDVRVILVPHHQGHVPDASFIWNYLSDFWNLVPDKKRFETVWSAMIQVTASEMLKLFQYQYNRSIRDIQEVIQKRWVFFSPALPLDRDLTSFILADDAAGSSASTYVINPGTGLPDNDQPTYSSIVTIPKTEGDFTKTSYGLATATGRLLQLGKRTFTLARVNYSVKSINYGVDGATSGLKVFTGSEFTSEMVGATLRLFEPASSALLGDYVIETVTDSETVEIANPPLGITWAGQTGLSYSVLPASAIHSSFFADQDQVPAGTDNEYWRLSSTLISDEYDFEEMGVSAGDLLEVEVSRVDLQVFSTFYAQVVGVDRNRLSFVLNLDDLEDGVAAPGITSDIQVTLATDLIVQGVSADVNGDLTYALDAALVNETVSSIRFKRDYFEKVLTPYDEIFVGAFSIVARPVQVIRNNKVAVDPTIVSIPILQEYIKQPTIIEEDGKNFFVVDDTRIEMARTPYLLSENLDYVIDDEGTINGTCSTLQGIDEITIPFGDLIDRSVAEGDTIEVTLGVTTEIFDIRRVLSADTIRVSPAPTISSTAALFSIYRRVPGKFIRFIENTFSKKSPAPERLWSEVTYFDNGEAIEGNFGVLVGVRREDLERVGSGIPYKSAVAGLMYALSRGPTIASMALSAQILLGLPFAQNAGVIQEINPDFRKRDDGSPRFGRVLVQARDRNNVPTGVTNIYFYPQGRQIYDDATGKWIAAVSEFSGLAINPDTGVEYAVGDIISQFAPLSKGVEIQEYLTTPDWLDRLMAQGNVATQLQKYHSFQVLVNSDLATATDIDLIAQFMKKVKAHYVRLTSGLLKSLEDFVEIEDSLLFGRTMEFFESPDLGATMAPKFDDDDSGSYLSYDGNLYTTYAMGTDLVTTYGSSLVQSAAGGFIDARPDLLESWDPPLLRAGDLLYIREGVNAGKYPVSDVPSDTELEVTEAAFASAVDQVFTVFRPLKNPIWSGQVTVTTGDGQIATQETVGTAAGIGSAGVSVGDLLVFAKVAGTTSLGRVYTVLEVNPDLSSPYIVITPDPVEPSDVYDAWIVREGLMTSGPIVPPTNTGVDFFVSGIAASNHLLFDTGGMTVDSWLNAALLVPGSRVVVKGVPYDVLRIEPESLRVAVAPALLETYTNEVAQLDLRPSRPMTPISFDFLDRIPADSLELKIVSPVSGATVFTTTGSTDTVLLGGSFTDLSVIPGDFLQFLEGGEASRDVGHGAGIFPIREILSGTVRLLDAMTVTGSFRFGLIRKINEG